ncbi:MAG: pantoate--beta-alanine ligase [Solirubrobacteraceae bacterium]|nr:pantoate--beta-alanine ligase [Solirubrobacteraceae bacterium]
MRTLRTVDELRAALGGIRRAGRTVGLVPTMGAFHDGHLSLIRRARADCDEVVVSLFVNPAQFRPGEDLDAYPRDESRDAALAADEDVDLLFAPPAEEVYPPGFATTVSVGDVTEPLEGAIRGREHFDGVATVVAKLLNMVGPDVAYFGQKDAQQAAVVRRMVADLNFPTRIEVCPTTREADGLAHSSRNAYLPPEERVRAVALRQALDAAEAAVAAGERDAARVVEVARRALADLHVEPDYLEVVTPDTFSPIERIDGSALIAVAARIGSTRLIDNALITTNHKDPR